MLGCVLACPVWCPVCFARFAPLLCGFPGIVAYGLSGLLSGPGVLVLACLVLVSGFLPSRSYGFKMRGPVLAGFGPGDLAVAAYSFSLFSGPIRLCRAWQRCRGSFIPSLSGAARGAAYAR